MTELADAGRSFRATGPLGDLGEWPDHGGDDVDDVGLALELAVDEEERVTADHAP